MNAVQKLFARLAQLLGPDQAEELLRDYRADAATDSAASRRRGRERRERAVVLPFFGAVGGIVQKRKGAPTMSDYRITPVAVDGFADADGIHVNQHGAWLGEVD